VDRGTRTEWDTAGQALQYDGNVGSEPLVPFEPGKPNIALGSVTRQGVCQFIDIGSGPRAQGRPGDVLAGVARKPG
jgi:hypothetical protein